MKKIILLVLVSISLYAKTIYILDTQDIIGKAAIEKGDILIIPTHYDIPYNKGVKIITCPNKECINYEVNRYKHMYRTNGIGVEVIR